VGPGYTYVPGCSKTPLHIVPTLQAIAKSKPILSLKSYLNFYKVPVVLLDKNNLCRAMIYSVILFDRARIASTRVWDALCCPWRETLLAYMKLQCYGSVPCHISKFDLIFWFMCICSSNAEKCDSKLESGNAQDKNIRKWRNQCWQRVHQ